MSTGLISLFLIIICLHLTLFAWFDATTDGAQADQKKQAKPPKLTSVSCMYSNFSMAWLIDWCAVWAWKLSHFLCKYVQKLWGAGVVVFIVHARVNVTQVWMCFARWLKKSLLWSLKEMSFFCNSWNRYSDVCRMQNVNNSVIRWQELFEVTKNLRLFYLLSWILQLYN